MENGVFAALALTAFAALCTLPPALADVESYYDNYLDLSAADLYPEDSHYSDFSYTEDPYAIPAIDEYQYYQNEAEGYYDTFGIEALDDYAVFPTETEASDCTEDKDGKANTTGAVCDLKISGVDKIADKLDGGVDGKYVVSGCNNGRPKYKREGKKDAPRTLWWSTLYSDWDLSTSAEVNTSSDSIVVFGGDGQDHVRPNFVPQEHWHMLARHSSQNVSSEVLDYMPIRVEISCATGNDLEPEKPKEDVPVFLMTDDEADEAYRKPFGRMTQETAELEPSVNFTMVILVALLGVGVVVGIPYIVLKPSSKGAKKSMLTTFLEERKIRAGLTK